MMDEDTRHPGLFAKGGIGRFLLVLTVGATLLVAGACGGLIALMEGLEHFLPSNDEASASANEEIASAKNEGAAFASGRTVTECVTEAQARGAARCNGDGLASPCGRTVAAFARACVSTATEDGYCATTPQPTGDDVFSKLDDIDAILEWPQAACKEFPHRSWCQEVMGEVQSACRQRQRNGAPADAAPGDELSAGSGASP